MDLLLDIAQGAGLAAAAGVWPFTPLLAAGLLAGADAGLDFTGTDYAFLEGAPFLIGLGLATAIALLAGRRDAGEESADPVAAILAVIAVAGGALLFAGSLADDGHTAWPGLVAGVACAALGRAAAVRLLGRAGRRLDAGTRSTLVLYAAAGALALAGACVLAPPVALPALAFLAWLLVGDRRRRDSKYAGLRVLR
jgi:hypothetical protein